MNDICIYQLQRISALKGLRPLYLYFCFSFLFKFVFVTLKNHLQLRKLEFTRKLRLYSVKDTDYVWLMVFSSFLSHFDHKLMTQNCYTCHTAITKQYHRTATPTTFWSQNNHAKLILLPHLDHEAITQNCYSCHTSVMKQSFRIDALANSGSQSSYWKLFLLLHFIHYRFTQLLELFWMNLIIDSCLTHRTGVSYHGYIIKDNRR